MCAAYRPATRPRSGSPGRKEEKHKNSSRFGSEVASSGRDAPLVPGNNIYVHLCPAVLYARRRRRLVFKARRRCGDGRVGDDDDDVRWSAPGELQKRPYRISPLNAEQVFNSSFKSDSLSIVLSSVVRSIILSVRPRRSFPVAWRRFVPKAADYSRA